MRQIIKHLVGDDAPTFAIAVSSQEFVGEHIELLESSDVVDGLLKIRWVR